MKTNRTAIAVFVILTALAAAAQSASQKSFDQMKSLAGSWQGTTRMGDPVAVSYRVTSGGSAVMSEIQSEKHGHEDMISMIHLDGDRLLLTHYCATGNQPRMVASASPDGKTITFDFLDVTNLSNLDAVHMNRVVFTFIDPNHHVEEWHAVDHGKEIVEVFDLQRKG